jgi:preprotein translocase subunit YajC
LTDGYTFSGFDGKFKFTYPDEVKTGYYIIWARNIAEDGNQSGLSDPVTVEVITPAFIKIGNININYSAIVVILMLLLLLIIIFLLIWWFFYRRKKKKQMDKIYEAEQVLEKSVKIICGDINEHIDKLKKARSERDLTLEEINFLEQFEEELAEAKNIIAKAIQDVSGNA